MRLGLLMRRMALDRTSIQRYSQPMNSTFSAASMYNLYDEEEDDERKVSNESKEENDQTRQKMQMLQSQMAKLSIKKKVCGTFSLLHPFLWSLFKVLLRECCCSV